MIPSKTYFQVLALSSHTSQVDTTYEGVAPCALVRLTFTWTLGAMLIRSVPPHLSVPKMSHVILIGVALV
jgi:hypothetical protein